jgi:Sec-independent protein secretion pathway component TatC
MQIWGFVAAGLYPNERKWVRGFAPVSILLFFAGALFLIVVVNPLLLDFLLTYRTELPDIEWAMPTRLVKSSEPDVLPLPESQPAGVAGAPLPAYTQDAPDTLPEGVPWFNRTAREIRVRYDHRMWTVSHLREIGERNRIVPEMRLSEIVPFTLGLAAAFGVGFQVPVVVALIAVIGVMTSAQMARYRRHVVFFMAIGAAIITPSPDPFSMMLLLIPMIGLFEAGLIAARRIERRRAAEA